MLGRTSAVHNEITTLQYCIERTSSRAPPQDIHAYKDNSDTQNRILPLVHSYADAKEQLVHDEQRQVLKEERLRGGESHPGGCHAPRHALRLAQRRQSYVLHQDGATANSGTDGRGVSGRHRGTAFCRSNTVRDSLLYLQQHRAVSYRMESHCANHGLWCLQRHGPISIQQ